jgi:NADH:ubiquinone oxidoreductase subunit 6 (subunit J)
MGLMVIFMVYTGAMMIMSMGSDEEKLSSAKRQIWYAAVALIFINIPGTLYEAFYKNGDESVGSKVDNSFDDSVASDTGNLFFDVFVFGNTVSNQIVLFLEVIIFLAAVFMITLAGINLMTSRGREEKMKEAKNKILYTILALIFVGIIEIWKRVVYSGEIKGSETEVGLINVFESLADLALFFAGPIAIFFLTLAGYYFITSNGDEERVKKAKSIIINTVLATLILLAAYTFLIDLTTL